MVRGGRVPPDTQPHSELAGAGRHGFDSMRRGLPRPRLTPFPHLPVPPTDAPSPSVAKEDEKKSLTQTSAEAV